MQKKSSKRPNRPERAPQKASQSGLNPSCFNSVAFATAARSLSVEAREWGHEAPSFRSPPRITGVRRSITRRPDGTATVAVATRNRSASAVMADMIEGVIVSAKVEGANQGAFRDALWSSVETQLGELLAAVAQVTELPKAS